MMGLSMPIPSPLHSRTAQLCHTHEWRDWSGYLAAGSYQTSHEVEYFAVRNAAGLLDASPLYKYELRGPDAGRLANRLLTRDVSKCKVGQMLYSPWCDEDGYVIDDGTLGRLGKDHYRLTAADPSLRWLQDLGYGLDVELRDVSSELAALALQGPNSRVVLQEIFPNLPLDSLRYYWLLQTEFEGRPLTVTRTGYTGDLGYELWLPADLAAQLWDRLMETGQNYGLHPLGLAALDMLRIEAGLILIEVDYTSSLHAHIPAQKSTPYEIGLGWAVAEGKADFIGQRALQAHKRPGKQLVGLKVSWPGMEREFGKVGLPPQVAGRASRIAVPVYANGRHVGQATSLVFSPILKTYIALATVESASAQPGTKLDIEITVEYVRRQAEAEVVKPPFYDPPQKKAVAGG